MSNINNYPIYPIVHLPHISQSLLMIKNKDKNEIPMHYNINNKFPLNILPFNGLFFPNLIYYMNFSSIISGSQIQDTFFLNKKRNNTSFENKNNKIKSNMKIEEIIQIKDFPKEIEDDKTINKIDFKILPIKENIATNFKEKEEKKVFKENNENFIFGKVEKIEEQENKKEIKEGIKRKKTKRKKYEELLHDTFLEHIGEKKIVPKIKNYLQSIIIPKTLINKTRKKAQKQIDRLTQISLNKNKKLRIKRICYPKKIKLNLKVKDNTNLLDKLEINKSKENTEISLKLTKVLFHGENYINTKSSIDFMKYNFNFIIEEQYSSKRIITDYEKQHINLIDINENFYNNYNNQNLDNIEEKWSRKKFSGDNQDLEKVINLIRNIYKERKNDINEENCLNVLKNNNYSIDNLLNKKNIRDNYNKMV